jgi:protein-L-isoaspartate(D-aspartate) O-methyltransferase
MSQTPSQAIHDDLAAHLRRQLVETLLQASALKTPAIAQSFLCIPREAFVPYFYEQETAGPSMAWKLVCADNISREDYLAAVYRNQSLVTKLDEGRRPVSSSSQPTVMARMLEALDVQPGQRVLEIGTGSGYNAALLAILTGEASRVMTIERGAELGATAREALERVLGSGVTVIIGDGMTGWPRGAPYDRIIATASAPTLPMAWVEQLRPNGKLVMDLQGTLASGFLVVEKSAREVSGHFLPEPLHFMPLETEAISVPQTKLASLLQQGCQATFTLEDDAAFPDALFDPAFRWFVQWRILGCQVSKRKQTQRDTGAVIHSILAVEPKNRALVRFQRQQEEVKWRGEVYGSVQFWQELQQAYETFQVLGEPDRQQYRLIFEEEVPALLIGSLKLPLTRM